MNKLIAISGAAGSGKDTVAKRIQYLTKVPGVEPHIIYTYHVKRFAGKLKQIVSLLTGIPTRDLEKEEVKNAELPEQWWYYRTPANQAMTVKQYRSLTESQKMWCELIKPTVRQMLQEIGTQGLRGFHPDIHINALFSDWTPESKWIMPDLRFPNEFEAIKARGGITIRVVRPMDTSGTMYQHESETALEGFIFDHVIVNDGTLEELLEKVKNILC